MTSPNITDAIKKALEEILVFRRHGFVPQKQFRDNSEKGVEQADWHDTYYYRALDGALPELGLTHSSSPYGHLIAVCSLPWDNLYHFATGSPVPAEKVPALLDSYMESIRAGRKFVPPQ